ncbi:hypothetical protein BGZ70_008677 [Mortierella alpina]|uniref:NAD-dependent epimerase/dehydratase domain-containing protein n=1 Tax=Mortierella alpina TaxID=64518 RepID=A0A9P6M1B6_MORAP|nr:hypothetical protein BGZ70_008677 [Mortierella alpina]
MALLSATPHSSGSVLVRKLVLNYPEYFVLVIDKLDYCSSLENLRPFMSTHQDPRAIDTSTAAASDSDRYPNFKFMQGDIADLDFVQHAMEDHAIDTIVHLAAQTHVDKSFGESIEFSRSNVLGTHAMLEAARKSFSSSASVNHPHAANGYATKGTKDGSKGPCRFIYISTDEVYGEVPFDQPNCKEDSPLAPSNPYSATKAAAECMVQAYYKSFHLPAIITRSNNVYGPFQYPEKIFPKFIMSLLNESRLDPGACDEGMGVLHSVNGVHGRSSRRGSRDSGGHCYIHGSGQHSRTYLYVADVANALDVILHRGEVGQVYNIGAGHEVNNLALAQDLIHRMVAPPQYESGCDDRPHHAKMEGDVEPQLWCDRRRDHDGERKAQQHLKGCRACADRIVFVELSTTFDMLSIPQSYLGLDGSL